MTQPLLAVSGIEKTFPGVRALKGVSFDVRPGEIHALVGENGAGKSTLMRVLAGAHRPDAGTIAVADQAVTIASPAESFRLGIAMVYQDTRLVPTLDTAANIWLGREPGRILVDRRKMIDDAERALADIGSRVDVGAPAQALSRAERQEVEIARALSRDARILILDEPTSALTASETRDLFALLRRLRAEGRGIVFISHRLPEVMELADRVTVMKDGEVVGTLPVAEADPKRLVQMMVGRAVELAYPPRGNGGGEELLAVEGLVAKKGDAPLDITLDAGEILGLAGVQGGGQQEVARALFGLCGSARAMRLDGRPYAPASPAEAIAAGLVYVPADRQAESLFLPHPIRQNVSLPEISRFTGAGGLIDASREDSAVGAQASRLAVKAHSLDQPVGTLSGGNQQKVVFARWFLAAPRVYVLDEPTQGVDVATKLELYRVIRKLSEDGAGVVVVSADLVELINLSDRILVFSEGRIVDELPATEASEERLVAGFTAGGTVRDAATESVSGRRTAWPLLARYTPSLLIAALLLLITALTASQAPYFFTTRNLSSIATQASPLILAALGQFATLLLGGIDLSIGPVISLTTAIASHLLAPDFGLPLGLGVAACLAIGLAVGLANGLIIVLFKIPDFIATLATFSLIQGLALIVRPAPGGAVDPALGAAILSRLGYVPIVFLFALAAVLLFELLLVRGRIGARLYAAGSSDEAARIVGIRTGSVRVAAYAFSGFAAAMAGLIIAARIGSGDPQAGSVFSLASVTAVVVGGTPVFGGSGTAIGTFLGAMLVTLVQNALNQLHVSAYWQYVWTGVLALAAVTIFSLRRGSTKSLRGRWKRKKASV